MFGLSVTVLVLSSLLSHTWAKSTIHYLHWNSTNPIFRIDNTDHIVDVNEGNLPWEYDQLNIICPSYDNRGTRGREEGEQYIIYNVSKEEYDTCRISQRDPRVVAVCDSPYDQTQFTITFRSFSPTPRGLEFRPGQDYYFISTSSARDLHRRAGGSCSTHNMKVIFKVAEPRDQDATAMRPVSKGPSVNVARQRLPEVTEEATDIVRPIGDVRSFQHQVTKGRYDRDPKSAIKQEASTMNGGTVRLPSIPVILFLTILMTVSRHLM